jgi:hypothetical protein
MSSGSASRNNANGISLFGVAHDEELSGSGLPNGKEAFFANRMIGVGHRDGQRIPEYSGCLLKSYPVIPLVPPLLIGIPREAHLSLGALSSAV